MRNRRKKPKPVYHKILVRMGGTEYILDMNDFDWYPRLVFLVGYEDARSAVDAFKKNIDEYVRGDTMINLVGSNYKART